MTKERALIHDFYGAFMEKDASKMATCYHPEVEFNDPVFGTLRGKEPAMMWQMLIEGSKGKQLDIVYRVMFCEGEKATVEWDADYEFSAQRRKVHNRITASLEFKDGKIIKHHDSFNFHRWACMALGFKGWLLGGTSFLKNKVHKQVKCRLEKYIVAHS